MKHSWTVKYIETQDREWVNRKRRELEQNHSVQFSSAHYRDRIVFLPYMNYPDVQPNKEDVPVLMQHLDFYPKSFIEIQKRTGWEYSRIFSAVKAAVIKGRASVDVNRMGKLCFVYARRTNEEHQN